MNNLDEIKKPIESELEIFQKKFRAMMKSSVPLLDRITFYVLKKKGKQMRPMFVLFSAKICGGITESTYRAAVLVELLHTATLVHDDVVDNSFIRRGLFSINALWKNKIAVLVGDYLLSKGLLFSVENMEYKLLEIVSTAVKMMSEGELLQIEKARKMDIEEEIYFKIIKNKTASLISSGCACGAVSANADKEIIERMRKFGEYVGIAFQIKDDLFDYGNLDIGKPIAIDIKEQKMTLPLIYALNNSGYWERRKIINMIKNNNGNTNDVREVINFVLKHDGISYTEKIMQEYESEAIKILNTFPEGETRNCLEQLVKFATHREV